MLREKGLDRKLVFWLARRCYSTRTAHLPDEEAPRRVLVVRVDERVGNLIMMQSLLDALRISFPDLELGLLSSVRMQRVTHKLLNLNRIHELDKRWFLSHPRRWGKVMGEVRKIGYQIAIDASAWHEFSFTHSALCYFTGAPMRIGFLRSFSQEKGNTKPQGFHTHLVEPGPSYENELKQHLRLLSPLGIKMDPPVLRSELGYTEQPRWIQWLQSRNLEKPLIGLWAGSRKLERRWPIEKFVYLAERLQKEHKACIIVLWGPKEEHIRDRLVQSLSIKPVVAPKTNLPDLAGILRCLDLLVTNDTGPMHLSVAVNTATLAVFASGEPRRWGYPYRFVRNLGESCQEPDLLEKAYLACKELLDLAGNDPANAS